MIPPGTRDELTEANFVLFCAKRYNNPQCRSTDEFMEDLERVKHVKKLLTRYREYGELRERLLLNHFIVITNLFGTDSTKILYLKLKPYFSYVKPFLSLLNVLPTQVYYVGGQDVVNMDSIEADPEIERVLREIKSA
jgi:hypothetical protein